MKSGDWLICRKPCERKNWHRCRLTVGAVASCLFPSAVVSGGFHVCPICSCMDERKCQYITYVTHEDIKTGVVEIVPLEVAREWFWQHFPNHGYHGILPEKCIVDTIRRADLLRNSNQVTIS